MDKKRVLEEKITRLLHMFPVVAIIGPRQCGSSTLVRGVRGDWKYYDLESPDDFQLISSDPVAFFSLNPDQVIIDEAQQFPDLFNMSDMARALEVSVSTVKDYLDIIHQTFLWRNLPAYTKNPLKKVQKAKKGFSGIRVCCITFLKSPTWIGYRFTRLPVFPLKALSLKN